jgi:hypothetical protein
MPTVSLEETKIRSSLVGNETKDEVASKLLLYCIQSGVNTVYLGHVYKYSNSSDSMITNFFRTEGLVQHFARDEDEPTRPSEDDTPQHDTSENAESEENQIVTPFTVYQDPFQRPQADFDKTPTPERVYMQGFFLNCLFNFQIPYFKFDFESNLRIIKNNLYNFSFNLFETMDKEDKFDVDIDIRVEKQNEEIKVELENIAKGLPVNEEHIFNYLKDPTVRQLVFTNKNVRNLCKHCLSYVYNKVCETFNKNDKENFIKYSAYLLDFTEFLRKKEAQIKILPRRTFTESIQEAYRNFRTLLSVVMFVSNIATLKSRIRLAALRLTSPILFPIIREGAYLFLKSMFKNSPEEEGKINTEISNIWKPTESPEQRPSTFNPSIILEGLLRGYYSNDEEEEEEVEVKSTYSSSFQDLFQGSKKEQAKLSSEQEINNALSSPFFALELERFDRGVVHQFTLNNSFERLEQVDIMIKRIMASNYLNSEFNKAYYFTMNLTVKGSVIYDIYLIPLINLLIVCNILNLPFKPNYSEFVTKIIDLYHDLLSLEYNDETIKGKIDHLKKLFGDMKQLVRREEDINKRKLLVVLLNTAKDVFQCVVEFCSLSLIKGFEMFTSTIIYNSAQKQFLSRRLNKEIIKNAFKKRSGGIDELDIYSPTSVEYSPVTIIFKGYNNMLIDNYNYVKNIYDISKNLNECVKLNTQCNTDPRVNGAILRPMQYYFLETLTANHLYIFSINNCETTILSVIPNVVEKLLSDQLSIGRTKEQAMESINFALKSQMSNKNVKELSNMMESFTTIKTDQAISKYSMTPREWTALRDCLQFSDDLIMKLKVRLCKYSQEELPTLYRNLMRAIIVYTLNKIAPAGESIIKKLFHRLSRLVHPDKQLMDPNVSKGFMQVLSDVKDKLLENIPTEFENMKQNVDRSFVNKEDVENTLEYCYGISRNVVNRLLEPVVVGGKRTKKRKDKRKKSKQRR